MKQTIQDTLNAAYHNHLATLLADHGGKLLALAGLAGMAFLFIEPLSQLATTVNARS